MIFKRNLTVRKDFKIRNDFWKEFELEMIFKKEFEQLERISGLEMISERSLN